MNVSTHDAYRKSLSGNLHTWQKRRSRALSPELLDSALILLRLDLDPLIPMFVSLYSTSPRGRPPWDPARMFRALLLMSLLRQESLPGKEAVKKQILAQSDSLTQQLKLQTLADASQLRPEDLQKRLEDSLIHTAVSPSARRRLLGPLDQIILCGDGSSLYTGGSSTGKPSCQCRAQHIYRCDCDRFYSDPTANWGWDSYREVYYFGHTYYQHVVSSSGHDLPVHLTIGQASESDFTLSIKSLDRFVKACAENNLGLTLFAVGYDAGHDALGNYEYLLAKGIRPVIALNPRSGTHPKPTGTAERVNDSGIPICPAGLEMRRHSQTPNHRIIYHCPVKRPTHMEGKHVWKNHVEECPHNVLCQPDTKMGPSVYVRSDADPRFYPEIARDSKPYREIMNLRSPLRALELDQEGRSQTGQPRLPFGHSISGQALPGQHPRAR